jgi:hypothetical protein
MAAQRVVRFPPGRDQRLEHAARVRLRGFMSSVGSQTRQGLFLTETISATRRNHHIEWRGPPRVITGQTR